MITISRMKAFNVDVEKQVIKVALEMNLQTELVNGLADGKQLVVTIEPIQRELPLDEPASDPAQLDLFSDEARELIELHKMLVAEACGIPDGEEIPDELTTQIADTKERLKALGFEYNQETETWAPVGVEDLANVEIVELIKRHAEAVARLGGLPTRRTWTEP